MEMGILYFAFFIVICSLFYVLIVSLLGCYFFISSCFNHYAPPVRCCGNLRKAILDDVSQTLDKAEDGRTIVDLGSGWGTLLLPLAKKFPQHNFVGVERAFTPYFISKIRAAKLPNLTIIKGDLFEYDLEKVDIAISFLIGFVMSDLTKKFMNELGDGAMIYSLRFPLLDVKPNRVVDLGNKMETYFVYKMK